MPDILRSYSRLVALQKRYPEAYSAIIGAFSSNRIDVSETNRQLTDLEVLAEINKDLNNLIKDKPSTMPTLNEVAAKENQKTIIAEVIKADGPITIPLPMEIDDAIKQLQATKKEQNEETSFLEDFDVFIEEGLYALYTTLLEDYGWFHQVKQFGRPPAMIAVKTGFRQTVQVPWGRFTVAGIPEDDGYFETGAKTEEGKMVKFRLSAVLKKKHSEQFHNLCASIRKQLQKTSLYRGKAISINFYDERGRPFQEPMYPKPDFPSIVPVNPAGMVFSRSIEKAIEANLYTPITKTDRVRKLRIPLKRGVLLAGHYGCGKTLIANRVKELSIQNGWTFIMAPTAKDFVQCVKFAHDYQPAVVFCEDIDRITDGDRDADLDAILNTVDGVDAKNTEIILVLTTNSVETMNPAALRPGRFGDAVIHIKPPDAEAVTRLIRYYAGDTLDKHANLTVVGEMLKEKTPAIISEVVERAKLSAVALDQDLDGQVSLTDDALNISADTMLMQYNLLNQTKVAGKSDLEKCANILGAYLQYGLTKAVDNYRETFDIVDETGASKILAEVK